MMKVNAIVAIICLGQILARGEAQVGKPAPDFSVADTSGKTHQLSQYKGKIVVLENYNLDCPFVVNHYKAGAMQALQAEAVGQGAIWLVVNSSYPDPQRAPKEVQSQKMKASALLYDPKGVIGKPYGFKTTPHIVIIDQAARVAYNGAIDDRPDPDHDPRKARNYAREALQKLGAGQPVAVANTKPYGCGAKYAGK